MQRGHELEDSALRAAEAELGIKFRPVVIEHYDLPWMYASLDGLSYCGKYAIEIKCPGKKAHSMALDGVVPDYYCPQIQHQWEASGVDRLFYYSFDGEDGVLIETKRDDEFIADMIAKEENFYECMEALVEPEATEKDYKVGDDRWFYLIKESAKHDEIAKAHSKLAAEYKQEAIDACGGQFTRRDGYVLEYHHRRGSIDYAAVPELRGVDLEKYRKPPSQVWKIKIPK